MKEEYDSLIQNGTWDLVSKPKHKTVLLNTWVFKVKEKQDGSIEKYKARLVARGDQQKQGIDYQEVFSPVARYESIRTFLACCVQRQMHVHQMDVVTAYVQGDLRDELYMQQPKMFIDSQHEDKVCKLRRPLYGLKQAGRNWYEKLYNYLTSINFQKTAANPCEYIDSNVNSDVIIVIYVDDLLIGSRDLLKIEKVKDLLKGKFKMKDLGAVKDILGIHIERESETGEMRLSQKHYVEELLDRFNMRDCNPVSTPLETNENFTDCIEPQSEADELEMRGKPYRELVGSIIYLANATHPDIAFAASALSKFCEKPAVSHWRKAKRVLRYLRGTKDCGIMYKKGKNELQAYTDADWGGDIQDRRSRSGYVVMLANGPISWSTKKQKCVALSTMEAEYISLSEVVKEIIYLRRLLQQMKQADLVCKPTNVFTDNQSAIALCKDSVHHPKSKHVDIRYHFTREVVENKEINVLYVSTDEMTADILTKALPRVKHVKCMEKLCLRQ